MERQQAGIFIWDKPLPDPEQLNAAIPQSEWERGLDGNPRAAMGTNCRRRSSRSEQRHSLPLHLGNEGSARMRYRRT